MKLDTVGIDHPATELDIGGDEIAFSQSGLDPERVMQPADVLHPQ